MEDNFEKIFTFDYVKVNDGKWSGSSTLDKALNKAFCAAIDDGIPIHKTARIIIDILPCHEGHIGVCVIIFNFDTISKLNSPWKLGTFSDP